jgi:hypothetical protein
MGRTYWIRDGVRRAKAAYLSGHQTIWAEVGRSRRERKVAISALLSQKTVIDVREPRQLERWLGIKNGMAQEPDLLPPIIIESGSQGIPIAKVQIVGEESG